MVEVKLAASVAKASVPLTVMVAIAAVTQAMVVLDGAIVNVALPSIRAGLRLNPSQLQWVVDAYLIALAGLLLPAARLGDLIGLKRVYLVGITLFTAASLAGGLAHSGGELIAARIAQGIGGAALAPGSLSLITATHSDEKARMRALSIWSSAAGVAGSIGLLLGGALTTWLSWRWVLFVNVPVGVALFVAVSMSLNRTGTRPEWSRLDLPGAVLATGGLSLFIYGLSELVSRSWTSPGVLTPLAAGAALFAAFIRVEARTRDPLVPLSIFRRGHLSAANALMLCFGLLITSTLLILSLYLQRALGFSALRTGLALLPLGAAIAVGADVSERLIGMLGSRTLTGAGSLVLTGGMLWMATLPTGSAYALHVLAPTMLFGLGAGLCMVPIGHTATSGIGDGEYGLASGLNNAARQLGGAVGVALVINIAASATRHGHNRSPSGALVHGYDVALLVCAGIGAGCALLSLLMPARSTPSEPPRSDRPGHTWAANVARERA